MDDGVATGSTYLASLLALKEMQVPKVIAAVPVGPPETLSRIAPVEDELVVLLEPPAFMAVGAHYEDFTQVEDEEVRWCLERAKSTRNHQESAK